MLSALAAAAAGALLLVHLGTCLIAAARCRPRAARHLPDPDTPAVTIVRPLCGIEPTSAATLAAAFAVDHAAAELLFCVARADDLVVPLVEAAIAANPAVPARLLVGDDPISINPKLNNMVKGWRAARYDWIAFIDSNVLVPPDIVAGLFAAWRPGTGAVSAPPVGIAPQDFWGHLECAFLNSYEARWQYAVDAFGMGFAQGKTLFYRRADLDRSGMRDLAAESAEDAATTKMVRRAGLKVRLAPPSPLPIGTRVFAEVWGRQLRWARLRRMTFLREFMPEILSGSLTPALLAALAAHGLGASPAGAAACVLAAWWGVELALIVWCRWPLSWRTPLALALRDVLMPAIWIGAFTGRSFTWKGTAMTIAAGTRPAE